MAASGNAIFGNLPLLFAIGVAIGLTENDGVAALAGTVGYVVFLAAMGICAKLHGIETATDHGHPVDRDRRLRRHHRRPDRGRGLQSLLPDHSSRAISASSRANARCRSSPRSPSSSSARVLSFIWPPIGSGIERFSHWAVHGRPALAFTIYGVVERALIPFGLHHVWNVPFFFQAGEYTDPATGTVVHGEIARFIAGDPTAGNMTGGYLFKMWGLPAAALAMWRAARPEQRAKVGGIMISAALTAFLTGITEPIEFAFLFVAPVLYVIHALLAGARLFPVHRARHQARLHLLARADRLHRALPEIARRAVAPGDRADLGGASITASFPSRSAASTCSRRDARWKTRRQSRRAPRPAISFALQLVRAFGGRIEHRQPRRLHHAPAREAGRRHQGQPRQAQGARRRRRGRRRRRHAGDLRHAQREPEDRDAGVSQDRRPRGRRDRSPPRR